MIASQTDEVQVMSKIAYLPMGAFMLAGVVSLAASSAAQAGRASGAGGDIRSHASAAPACGKQCPVLADDTGPGSPGDHNGRSAALSQGGREYRVAGGRIVGSDFHASAAPAGDTGKNVASTTARSGQIPRLWHPVLADNGSAGGMNDDNGGRTDGGRGGIGGDL
jgi:hypothetical protein